MRSTLVKWGRPRIEVDIKLLKCLRNVDRLGWMRIEQRYCIATGNKVSRDTLRRRYLEDRLDRLEQLDGRERCRFKILRYGTPKKKRNICNTSKCNWKPPKTKTRLSTCSFHARHQCGNVL